MTKYFKDNQNNVFAYSDIQTPKDGLTKITEQEALELTNPPPTPEQILAEQIAEAKQYLLDTDHKFYIGYVPKPDEDCTAIKSLRDEKREFIRANE